MTAFYIAARFSRRPEAHALAKALQLLGHTVTARWVLPNASHAPAPAGPSPMAAFDDRQQFAIDDLADVRACDVLVALTEPDRSNGRGGRHVEYGYAAGAGKRLVCIGPRETVFHCLPGVQQFDTLGAFLSDVPNVAPARCDIERQGDEEFCRTCARRWDINDAPPCNLTARSFCP